MVLFMFNGIGKEIRIAVLTNEENFSEAESAGATIVGNDDLIEQINQGNIQFDLLHLSVFIYELLLLV